MLHCDECILNCLQQLGERAPRLRHLVYDTDEDLQVLTTLFDHMRNNFKQPDMGDNNNVNNLKEKDKTNRRENDKDNKTC